MNWAQNGSPNLNKYAPKGMFVTKKAQPNKFEILLNVRQLDGLVTYQFDNMYVRQLLSLTIYPFGNLSVRQFVTSETYKFDTMTVRQLGFRQYIVRQLCIW
jgi:hypothetical protein